MNNPDLSGLVAEAPQYTAVGSGERESGFRLWAGLVSRLCRDQGREGNVPFGVAE